MRGKKQEEGVWRQDNQKNSSRGVRSSCLEMTGDVYRHSSFGKQGEEQRESDWKRRDQPTI